jgi:hypothetical protein
VLALDTTGTGADLVVGAPGDGAGTGKVFLFTADGDFFAAATADTTAVRYSLAGPEVGGRFGSAMAAAYTGPRNTGSANLIVGAPATGRGGARQMAGAAYFFGHGTSRSFPLLDQVYGKAANDQLGTALAGGEINAGLPLGDLIPDFATLAPGANAGAGAAYAILGH